MTDKLKKILEDCIGGETAWYRMNTDARRYLFGDAVKNVYCAKGMFPSDKFGTFHAGVFALGSQGTAVIEFENGNLVHVGSTINDAIFFSREVLA